MVAPVVTVLGVVCRAVHVVSPASPRTIEQARYRSDDDVSDWKSDENNLDQRDPPQRIYC
jgi:hypothetical protein